MANANDNEDLIAKLAEYLYEREERVCVTKMGSWPQQPGLVRDLYFKEARDLARFLRALKQDHGIDVRQFTRQAASQRRTP